LKDAKLIKKQTYTKTEACRLYSRVFWIFLPNVIKIDPYNFWMYHFIVAHFSETQCIIWQSIMCIVILYLLWYCTQSKEKEHSAIKKVTTGVCTNSQSVQRYSGMILSHQYVTTAQIRTGHCPLLASYLHSLERQDFATYPQSSGAEETAEHLILQYPTHDQIRQEILPDLQLSSIPRLLWSYLKQRLGQWLSAVIGNERERGDTETSALYTPLNSLTKLVLVWVIVE